LSLLQPDPFSGLQPEPPHFQWVIPEALAFRRGSIHIGH